MVRARPPRVMEAFRLTRRCGSAAELVLSTKTALRAGFFSRFLRGARSFGVREPGMGDRERLASTRNREPTAHFDLSDYMRPA